MLSGLSLGTWATVRGLDPDTMLSSVTVFMKRVEPGFEKIEDTIKAEEDKVVQKYVRFLPISTASKISRSLTPFFLNYPES
jgi:hypothetical protein